MDDHRQILKDTFDSVADGYDSPALRFFSASAEHMADLLGLRGDEEVLDVACGTGHAALAFARRLPRGRVTAIDFSPAMLERARNKAAAVPNIEFIERDMQALGWQRRFDVAVCAFGIFFVEDMDTQLAHIASTVKPGGTVMISTFQESYMEPLRSMLLAQLAGYGVQAPPQIWKRIAHVQGCRELFERAGLRDIRIERRNVGYFLSSAQEWWEVIWNAGFRRMVGRLPPADQARFRQEHLPEIEALRTRDGIWMDVGVLFAVGTRPA
jgi:ubiquinone/menaquinone biosynthesis C-methylase UbiE